MEEIAIWAGFGRAMARARLATLDPARPAVPQACAVLAGVATELGHVVEVRPWGIAHVACPWGESHRRAGSEPQCRARCDAWLDGALAEVSAALGTPLRMRTLQSIPDGEAVCARRVWVEK